ncbi:LacI family DNA-binding transcriptional regulator [Nocardia sp. alder85J]|uniref:LacI family DNA-binding transcriptional regulator n=1 Tax=Nocardia sp. alder85J TaxID=2862949 RepID=UPI001CD4EC7D|nr:LacI family DNA-binding transcriptional regulator [Nocardia sp. alder85J]MCX4092975.1 LacI family DNA-binding transcriptional regulator [Nocardia sp. alder85J]
MARRVTLRDVAAHAGVSPATVSFVLNAAPGQSIPEPTRDRVRRAAAELGYVPHSLARALREGNSRLVVVEAGGLLWARLLENFVRGLGEELANHGHTLLVSFTGPGQADRRAAIESLSPRAVIDLPALYDRPDRATADGGWIDGMAAHYATQIGYLHGRGHRHLAVAAGPPADPLGALMTEHIRSAATALGMQVDAVLRFDPAEDPLPPLTLPAEVTAIAALNDELALAALAAGSRDVAVIGLGDSVAGALRRPALTTVRIDTHAYGRRAGRDILGLPMSAAKPAATEVVARATA